jgi:hypothetical protein
MRSYTNKVPEKIANKKELKMKLERIYYFSNTQRIEAVQGSRLPE